MTKYLLFAATGLAAAAAASQATNEITVSATRIETPIEQIGSSISVVDHEAITQQNAQNLQKALKLVPGLQSTANGGPGTASGIFIRGAEADHTLVLINGVRVNSNTAGGFDFNSLPVDMIERIEILRGPQSSLYGSDALGGVVNITTKKGAGTPFGGSASASIGEKGYRTGTFGLHGGGKGIDFYTSLSFTGLETYDIAAANGGTEDDPYRRLSGYAGVGVDFATDGRADLTLTHVVDKNELDGFGGADNPLEYSEKEKWFAALSVSKPITDTYTQKASAGYNMQNYTGYNAGAVDYTSYSYDTGLQADLSPTDNNTLSVGYEARRSEAENEENFDRSGRTQHALFANNQWKWKERLFIQLGGRYDEFSDIDGRGTWKTSASWFAFDATRLHGSAGTGYRAPTMNDIYYTFGGPPRTYLQPEKSRAFDIGIEQSFLEERVVADITYFQSAVKDLIEWTQVSPGIWQPDNVDEADIEGFETSLSVQPAEQFAARIFYTYTDAKNGITGTRLARRALHTGGASVQWHYSKAGVVHADYTYTGERFEDTANTLQLADFGVVGVGVRHALTDSSTLVLHVSNLFDKYYETAAGYGNVGRVASAGIETTF
jgi:vitamin B12 transporter